MNLRERLSSLLFSSDLTLKERMYLLSGVVGSAVMVASFVLSLSFAGPVISSGMGIAAAFFIVVIFWSFRKRRLLLGGSIVVIVCLCIILPFGYIFGGGAYSGSPTYFCLGAIFIFLLFEGRLLVLYFLMATAAFGTATLISAIHPDWVVPLEGKYAIYMDTFLAPVLLGLLAGILLKYQAVVFSKENKKAEERKRQIEQLNASQNQFFSSMSHEIRTPINTIIGLNEMILREENLSPDTTENALNIQNASKMLLALINDILDLSKIEAGQMEVSSAQYETSRMLSDVVNLLWARAKEKGLRFDVNVGDDIPSMLYGDEMRLKQIIINLLTNAIKYTDHGSVSLSVNGEKTEANDFLLRIDVDDTGAGIRKENLPYLFDTFRRVDEDSNKAIEGTGLGLAISKQLVELMGGHIAVDSIYTKGSSFHVEVAQQIVDEQPMSFHQVITTSRPQASYEQSFEAPEARVLVVDDNDMNRMVVRKLLRGTLVQTDLVASGRECLEQTRKIHYDAIFMDHEMPEMDGIETLRQIRSQSNGLCKNTPVIALTANAGSDMDSFYLNQGFHAYLAKPIHGSLLEATLLQLLPSDLVERSASQQAPETVTVSHSLRRKKPLAIAVDSVCDIPESLAAEHGIRLISNYVSTEEGRFRDVREIDSNNLFSYLEDETHFATTDACTVEEYENHFGEMLLEAEAVIHLSASKTISNGYERAVHAASSFGAVHVVDSHHLSGGLGLMALRAAELAEEGLPLQEILTSLETLSSRISSSMLIAEPDYLFHSDRLHLLVASFLSKRLIRSFNLQPAIFFKRGSLRLRSLYARYVSGTSRKFIRRTLQNPRSIDPSRIIITYTALSAKEQEELLNEVQKRVPFQEVLLQKSSAAVANNCGPGAIGLFFKRKG